MANYTLYHGDCLVEMSSIPDKSVQCVIADLPYSVTQNVWDSAMPLVPLWEQYKRICAGAIILTASQPFSSLLVCSNIKNFKHEWIWIKNRGSNFANTVREPFKEHEHVLVFSYGKWTYNKQMQQRTGNGAGRVKYKLNSATTTQNYGKFKKQNPWQGEKRVPSSWQKFNTEVGLHPTQKPVTLMEYLVKTYTDDGDTVLDNVMGSGTTGVACANTGRNFIGIEIYPLSDKPIDKKTNPNYFPEAQKRIAEAYSKPRQLTMESL